MSAVHPWGHDALAEDLAGYLSSSEVMIWTDMQLGPSGSPRPDVYLLRKSYSKPLPIAFECKISRSDLRSDTTSGKWQTYLKYAAGVVFAVPDGLCTVADIPDGCGLIVRKAKEWRYVRRPTLHKVTVPFDACMKLLIDGVHRTHTARQPKPRVIDTWREHEAVRKRFGEDVAQAAKDLAAARERLARINAGADEEWERQKQSIELRAKRHKEQIEADDSKISNARAEILAWLGMESGSIYDITRRIAELKMACAADARVRDAEQRLKRARSAMEHALAHVPEVQADVPMWGSAA